MRILTCEPSAFAKCRDASGEPDALVQLESANRSYETHAFAEALREYRTAYALCRSEILFFGIASCEGELGREAESARDFDRFLREASDAEQDLRQQAADKLRALATRLTSVTVTGATSAAAIFVDQQPVSGWAPDRSLYLAPGRHTLRVEGGAGGRFEDAVTATAGGRLSVAISLAALPSPKLPQPISHHRWWLWGGVATVLIAGVATAFLLNQPGLPACPTVCPH